MNEEFLKEWEEYSTRYVVCPNCGLPVSLNLVNNLPENNVGGDYNFHVYCMGFLNLTCDYEEYLIHLEEHPDKYLPKKDGDDGCGGCGKAKKRRRR
jgi:hypothetical protein